MEKSEILFCQNEVSASATNAIKTRIINIMKFFKRNLSKAEEESLMQAELESIFPILVQNLNDSFFMIVHSVCTSKRKNATFSAFINEFGSLLMLIRKQLFMRRISYVIIPCISSIASMMYYVDETFSSSQDILLTIFVNYVNLRLHILDCIYKTITVLQSQNLAAKYMEKITKSVLLFMQSIPTNPSLQSYVNADQRFEETQQQLQSLTIHWISLFIGDINCRVANDPLSKIFNNFIRHVVKMLNFIEFPSAPYYLIIILRTLMSSLSSVRSTIPMKKFALEQICFIIINMKKMITPCLAGENAQIISNIRHNLRSALEKSGNSVDFYMCVKLLLIRYIEQQYSNTDSSSSLVSFYYFSFLRFVHNTNQNGITHETARKRKSDELVTVTSNVNGQLWYYSQMLKTVSIELQRSDVDIIYRYLVFLESELHLLVDRYFDRIILATSVKNNSLRLSAVKQLVPLIEVDNNLLFSRIIRIAIRSLILDHFSSVRESILITLGKIVLLYKPYFYAPIFEENFKNILMRVLDVSIGVRKAVLYFLRNFCIKNRNNEKVLRILSCILSRIQDKNESVRFQTADIFKQLWFTSPEAFSTNAVVEIVYLSNRNPDNLIHVFNYIFVVNSQKASVPLFDVCKQILIYVAHNGNKLRRENLEKLKTVIAKLCQHLTKENANYMATFMNRIIPL